MRRKKNLLITNHTLLKPNYKFEEVKNEIRRIGKHICRKLRSKQLVAGFMHLAIRFEDLKYDSNILKLTSHTNDDREIFNSAISIYKKLLKPTEKMKARQFGMGVYDLHLDTREINLHLFENRILLPYNALDYIKTNTEKE